MYLAALGLVLSAIVHVISLLGMTSAFGQTSWILHIGIFVVWLPTIFVISKKGQDFKQMDFWRAAFRACPKWMIYMTYILFGYAIFNFIVFSASGFPGGGTTGSPGNAPTDVFRGFSGHWMAFYSAALAALYSAIHVEEYDGARRCPFGHPVSPDARFCEVCGEEIVERQEPG